MNKPNLAGFVKTARRTLSEHSPEILRGVGITGLLSATVFAVRATPKALELIADTKKAEGKDKLTPVETVKATWKCYIPTAAICATSLVCLFGASSIDARRSAALLTAYKLSETTLMEYRDKVAEVVGEKKEQAVREDIQKDRLEKAPVHTKEVYITERGNTLCFDHISGRYFKSDIDQIKKAENELNRRIITDMYASLNEFYDMLGLEHVGIGYELGWNIDGGNVEIDFGSHLASDGTPCLVMDFGRHLPRYAFSTFS